jgi:enamine deaminase RidA (YjgF/YER057c/UK114 family)
LETTKEREVMLADRVRAMGYDFVPAPLDVLSFHAAVRTGNLVFTSGQVPMLGETTVRGKVGGDLDLEAGYKAAEICAVNCLRAVAAVADPDSIVRIVKVLGMVNVADGFDDTSSVINGATDLLNAVIGEGSTHARSAVGMVLPNNWAVEVELVAELRA